MKKPTRSLLKRKLDKAIGEIVRARGVCARCGKGAEKVTLHCAHIFSRTNMSVRWDEENCLALCFHCHFYWAHTEPILFTEFVRAYLGRYKYVRLKQRAAQIKQWTVSEMQELLDSLDKEKK